MLYGKIVIATKVASVCSIFEIDIPCETALSRHIQVCGRRFYYYILGLRYETRSLLTSPDTDT
jgi:hypothetical protein